MSAPDRPTTRSQRQAARIVRYPTGHQFRRDLRGRTIPEHTPRLKGRCRCISCDLRRWWTPERRAAHSELLKRQFATGARVAATNINERRASTWKPAHDARLRELAGKYDALTIARMLTEEFGHPRTESSVDHAVKRLGIFLMDIRPLTSSEVGRIFGISRETVRSRFVKTGLLRGTMRRGGPHGMRMFTRDELVALVREHPEAYDPSAIRDGELKLIAQSAHRGRQPLPTPEVEKLTGVNFRQLAKWYSAGLVPSARRVAGVRPGRFGTWLIDPFDLATVRQLKADHEARQTRRAEACPSGHPKVPENLYIEPGSGERRCLPCRAQKHRRSA